MPPKRNQRNADDDDADFEGGSSAGTPSAAPSKASARRATKARDGGDDDDSDGGEHGRPVEQLAFQENMELLLEKRGSLRVAALRKLASLLQMHVFGDFLENEAATFLLYTLRRVRSSAAEEIGLAATAIALAFLQLPYGLIIDEIEEVRKVLLLVAHDHTADPAARASVSRRRRRRWLV